MNFENGYLIKSVREKKKLKKTELAKLVGVSSTYIAQLENGIKTNPSIDVLNKIAKSLNINISDLVNNDVDIIEVTPPVVMIEKIISDLYQFEVDTKNKRVFIYDNRNIDLILSINEFNLLTNDVVKYIKNRIEFLNNLKKADIDG